MKTIMQSSTPGILVVLVALTCISSSNRAQAACPEICDGNSDTGVGNAALGGLTGGQDNTAVGDSALGSDDTGSENTAVGFFALARNHGGNWNTACGAQALQGNISGQFNTAHGFAALALNTASNNTAVGYEALSQNNTGGYNTAAGTLALSSNQSGGINVADGYSALQANINGFYNVACGGFALGNNTAGSYNVATGANALYYNKGSNNTATGHQSLQNNTSGGNNVAVGYQAGNNLTTGSNNIVIGANVPGAAGDANKIRIGKQGTQTATYIAGISGKTVASASAVAVFVDNTGKLGTIKSSARFKEEIEPMNKASEAILQLEPVTFRYKHELDPDGVQQFGLIAEQVEKVAPDLVVHDEDGKVSTVRYEAVNAMLLNEFLKEHRKVEEQDARLVRQEELITKQQKQIDTLTATMQRVSDKLNMNKSAPHLAAKSR
jgi:Chaperone of endosialidase